MAGLNWTFEKLADYYAHPTFEQFVLNPIIERLLSTCPGSSIFSIGGHSVVLRISPTIVAKVSLKAGDERLRNEQALFELLAESNCPHLVRCHLHASDVSFLELIANGILHDRMHTAKPRPVLAWMLQLSHAAACLEAIGYAHGDINPINILLDDNDQVKLIDFDHSLKVGDGLYVGYEPYVRNFREPKGGQYGVAGPATEQFALGSVFWYMTRGTELYSELEGHEQVDRLLDGIFPTTDPQDPIDRIISNCWNGHYPKIADLVDEIQVVSGLNLQTQNDGTSSQGQEPRLLCEEYCKMANLTLT
ncbi:protein kinase domain-containing protein [Cordyceps fumosorosea ARSEF 2679]|uniref:Protein kinase domain-containing protein n=1 Tax=Cordyceps fumosorosea (strain ARSEF 2679) TaxID=1081104 RepID=A0A167PNK5_CORFA|nr:protein kinase domain-containing protein [Cordyceps fumosorosea ARSEF 2679]OAA56857.1 protein kinase domain-containing protein [Cordyceps fumosorosea ARSEF 2679]